MKCQNCGKNHANVSYTRIINGERTELHLCSECAKEMNIEVNFHLGFQDMFSDFLQDFSKVGSLAMPGFNGIRSLERDWNDWMGEDFLGNRIFPMTSFLTNGSDVDTEKDEVEEALNGIQRKFKKSTVAKEEKREEKEPEKKPQDEIAQLKAKLQEYIKKEEYEKAAVVRDLIKEKEKEGKQ